VAAHRAAPFGGLRRPRNRRARSDAYVRARRHYIYERHSPKPQWICCPAGQAVTTAVSSDSGFSAILAPHRRAAPFLRAAAAPQRPDARRAGHAPAGHPLIGDLTAGAIATVLQPHPRPFVKPSTGDERLRLGSGV